VCSIRTTGSSRPTTATSTTRPRKNLDRDPRSRTWLSFTAKKPGIYRFAVGLGRAGLRRAPGLDRPETLYSLQITGIGNMAVGGIVATNSIVAPLTTQVIVGPGGVIQQPGALKANIETVVGDLGAVLQRGGLHRRFGRGDRSRDGGTSAQSTR
jgi:hypothetical protein